SVNGSTRTAAKPSPRHKRVHARLRRAMAGRGERAPAARARGGGRAGALCQREGGLRPPAGVPPPPPPAPPAPSPPPPPPPAGRPLPAPLRSAGRGKDAALRPGQGSTPAEQAIEKPAVEAAVDGLRPHGLGAEWTAGLRTELAGDRRGR